jgi:hypothetical protein
VTSATQYATWSPRGNNVRLNPNMCFKRGLMKQPHQCQAKAYHDYYLLQAGRGYPVYVGIRYQKGHELGTCSTLVWVGGTPSKSNSDFVHSQEFWCTRAIFNRRCLSMCSVASSDNVQIGRSFIKERSQNFGSRSFENRSEPSIGRHGRTERHTSSQRDIPCLPDSSSTRDTL